ncbi:hypothetical protein D3C72_2291090 [compost metagenome]
MFIGRYWLIILTHHDVDHVMIIKFLALLLNEAQYIFQGIFCLKIFFLRAAVIAHVTAALLVKIFPKIVEDLFATTYCRLGIINNFF